MATQVTAYLVLSILAIILPFITGPVNIFIYTLFFLSANILLFIMLLKAIKHGGIVFPCSLLYYLPLLFLLFIGASRIYSINPGSTMFGFLLFGSGVICAFSIHLLGLSKKVLCWLASTLMLIVTLFSLYAIYQYLAVSGNYGGRAHSVFVNPNSFSGYLVLVIPLLIGCYLTQEKHWKWLLIPIALQYGALLASGKGGRWVVFFAAILFVVLFYKMSFRKIANISLESENHKPADIKKRFKLLLSILFLITALFIIPVGSHNEAHLSKIKETFPPMAERFKIWESTWQIIKDNPVMGTGYFTFHNIYLKYKNPAFRETLHSFSHNDYLQLWSEVGIAGLGIFMTFLLLYFKDAIKILRSNGLSTQHKYILGGTSLGSFLMLIHSLIDFDLYIPAILFIFWCYVGYTLNEGKNAGLYREGTIDFTSNRLFILLGQKKLYILASAFFLFSSLWLMTPYLGIKHGEKGSIYLQSKNYEKAAQLFRKAINIDPLESSHHYNLANALLASKSSPESSILQKAEEEFKRAIELDPYRAELSFRLSKFYLDYYPKQKDSEAIRLLKKTIELDPTDPNNTINLVKTYQHLNLRKQALVALEDMKRAYPDYTPGIITLIEEYRDAKDYERALKEADSLIEKEPNNNYAHFLKANIFQGMGQYDAAYAEYQLALREKGREGDVWYAIGLLSLKQNKPKQAEAAFRKAVEYRSLDQKEKRD